MKTRFEIPDFSSPVVMTILNVTPDSFWQGSRRPNPMVISRFVEIAVSQGASIIDVGGYSSRPGAADVSPEDEYGRVAAAMEIIRRDFPDMVVSVDTFRSEVARRVIETFGPCIINDISAGTLDEDMLSVVASFRVPYVAMHMKGNPADMQTRTGYDDIIAEVLKFLQERIIKMRTAGIENIILDPGFGFAKTTEQNYVLLDSLDKIVDLGYPVLSGVSRKSMIYKVLECEPSGALTGTSVLNWESLTKGAKILRVHDTREATEVIKLYEFYRRSNGK